MLVVWWIYFEICLMLECLYWIYCFYNFSVFVNNNRQFFFFLKIDGPARQLASPPLGGVGCEFEPTPSSWPAPPCFWRANSGLGLNRAGWPVLPSLLKTQHTTHTFLLHPFFTIVSSLPSRHYHQQPNRSFQLLSWFLRTKHHIPQPNIWSILYFINLSDLLFTIFYF